MDSNMLVGKKVGYVGPHISSKNDMKGPYLDSYYVLNELKSITYVEIIERFNNKKYIKSLISCDVIWMEYPFGRFFSLLVIVISILFNKALILRIHDLPVEQAKDLKNCELPASNSIQLKIIEKLIVWKANVIILSAQNFINYIHPRTSNIIVFPPGVCKDELINEFKPTKNESDKYILAYAGSLDRGGMIENISSMFTEIHSWELWIAGGGKENINHKNTKYLGLLPYLEVREFYKSANAIIIPYPKKEYYEICLPLKIGEVLITCKPIIMMKLPAIEQYLDFVGLENNVIFVDEWSKMEVEKAIKKAENLKIDCEYTINKLKIITWETRTKKLMAEINNECLNTSKLCWI